MKPFDDILLAYYEGEIVGEAVFGFLCSHGRDAGERLKWATLLQLETETKAWLRSALVRAGLDLTEPVHLRDAALARVDNLAAAPWLNQMRMFSQALTDRYVPQYEAYVDAVRAEGNAYEIAICSHMLEHELVQLEFARLEIDQNPRSLEVLQRHLRYPLASSANAEVWMPSR